ncbi:hypothetical protein AGMMS50262_14780 [Bacteroidia bacterium]|nr:hypothetical protein AGMMS50262_14780 [Bacteroidia bacterium]
MRKTILVLLLLLWCIPALVSAQHILESTLTLPRSGEEIIKQQVDYKDPGRSGANVLWDFGQQETVNEEYTLSYSSPELIKDSFYIMGLDTILQQNLAGGSLLIGAEHNTMYYYYLTGNRLWVLGHENPTTLLHYTQPLIAGFYPLSYGNGCSYDYQAEGLYSSSVPFTSDGEAQLQADAYGMMILPSGDTLRHVLRTRTVQTIRQVFESVDSTTTEQHSSIETFKWYSKGYRYPVFETIRTTVLIENDTAETVNFETAFFFPPQEQYYLEEDVANAALLEEETGTVVDPWAGLTWNIFPNPVKNSDLSVEIYLPRNANNVHIQLRNPMGLVVSDKHSGFFAAGTHAFGVDTRTLPVGNYILDIWLDEKLISEIILKR